MTIFIGESNAVNLSSAREVYGVFKVNIKGDKVEDTIEDTLKNTRANSVGISRAKSRKYSSSREACAVFRPNGLNKKN